MSIDSLVNFLLSIENFPVSIASLVLNFATTIITYIIDRKNKNQKPFYSYLFKLLTPTLWIYLFIYFEPNTIVTFIRYAELIFTIISTIIFLVFLLIVPGGNLNILNKNIKVDFDLK